MLLKLELAIVVDFAHHFVKAMGYGLNGLVKRFCAEVGIFGNFPGHSGKVTCATELYISEVDEQLIQAQTGHRSTSSVRCYKRTQEEHMRKVSRILQPPPIKKSSSCEYHEKEHNLLAYIALTGDLIPGSSVTPC